MRNRFKMESIPGLLAASYEKAARLVIESYYAKIAEEIVSDFKAGLLLDLGTGPGYLPIEIAKRCPEIRIIGVDLCDKLIRTARANAEKAGLSGQIRFETGNAGALRFGNAAFDRIISTGMLHSLRDPVGVLKEIHRLLKPGASALIYDPASVSSLIDRDRWHASLSHQDKLFLKIYKMLGLLKPLAPFTRNQIEPLLAAAGFKRYTIEEGKGEIKIILQAG
jgi:ubiquinone/menaquinone biosynthesis C-methylase UbiE